VDPEIIISILMLVVVIVLGIPVPFAFGAVVLYLIWAYGLPTGSMLSAGEGNVSSVILLAIPLFILAGGIIERAQIGDRLIGFVEKFTGRINGSLAMVVTVASGVFGAICGSATATMTCIGGILAPRMKKSGYPQGVTSAVISCSSVLGLLIPPSGAQIMYAWLTGQSVLACFLSTVIPGILIILLMCVVSGVMLRKYKLKAVEVKETPKEWFKDFGRRTKKASLALIMPIIILGGIYTGWMTPTESAAIAVFYALIVGVFVYRVLRGKELKETLISTATTTGVVMIMFFVVMMFSRIYIMQNVPNTIIDFMMGVTENKYLILLMMNLFMIIMGMLMDDTSSMLLCAPMLLPLAQAIGIHPVHFAAVVGVNLGMGNLTPPTAPLLYLGSRITGASISESLKPAMAYLFFAWIPVLILTTYVPDLALFLPRLFGYVQ